MLYYFFFLPRGGYCIAQSSDFLEWLLGDYEEPLLEEVLDVQEDAHKFVSIGQMLNLQLFGSGPECPCWHPVK